jgi:taurine dioxygenase
MRHTILSPALGVEVHDLDLHGRHGDAGAEAEAEELRRLLAEHQLLFVRCPDLSGEEQVRFCRLFGPVLHERPHLPEYMFVSNVVAGAAVPEGRLLFHSDLAFTPEPHPVLCLYALDVPPGGCPTRFANADRAAARLDPGRRARLTGRDAVHIYDLIAKRGDRRYRDHDTDPRNPRQRHPVLLVNPRSGREVLYVSEMQTDRIEGLPSDESDALLEDLFALLYAADNVYEHHWQVGDLVLWDNLAVQHGRGDVPDDAERTLRRVALGERTIVEMIPNAEQLLTGGGRG